MILRYQLFCHIYSKLLVYMYCVYICTYMECNFKYVHTYIPVHWDICIAADIFNCWTRAVCNVDVLPIIVRLVRYNL